MYSYSDIKIRPIEDIDLEFIRDLHNQESTLSKLTDIKMINKEEQKLWYNKICLSKTSSRFIVLKEGITPIGCIRMDNYDPVNRSVQIGGDIHECFRGNGYGKKMLLCCLEYSFNVLNCHRVYLNTMETNTVAINMYCSCGLIIEGRNNEAICRDGKYIDCICLYMTEEMYKGITK